jgi:hypothetical protein
MALLTEVETVFMKALGVGVEDFFGEAWLYVYTRLNWVERINDVEVAN